MLQSRGFPIALGLVTIGLGIFSLVRIRSDPPLPLASRGNFVPVDQSSPGGIEPAPRLLAEAKQ